MRQRPLATPRGGSSCGRDRESFEFPGRAHVGSHLIAPSQAQNAALEAIRREVELSPHPLDGSSPEAALQELLGPLSSSCEEHVAQAAYEPDLVSLPEVVGSCDLTSQLEGPDRRARLVSFEESLLLSENAFTQRVAEEGLPTPYWDDALVGDEYISFVNWLFQSGMLTLSLGCRWQAGIFFVRKKSGRLRMIVERKTGQPAYEATTKDVNALGRRVFGASAWAGREAEGVDV